MTTLFAKRMAIASAAFLLTATAVSAHHYKIGALQIGHPWTRPTPPSAPTAVGYLTVTNTGKSADRLLGGASPSVDHIELHEMTLVGGVMRMRPVAGGLEIAPGKTLTLAPSGYHLMLIGPKHRFTLGERVSATLRFQKAGTVRVDFLVEAAAPTAADHAGHLEGGQ